MQKCRNGWVYEGRGTYPRILYYSNPTGVVNPLDWLPLPKAPLELGVKGFTTGVGLLYLGLTQLKVGSRFCKDLNCDSIR